MAEKTVKVKPNPERTVNGRAVQVDHPFQTGRKINTNGEEIQDCSYIQRRFNDGDLVYCDKKKQAAFDKKRNSPQESQLDAKLDELDSLAEIPNAEDCPADNVRERISLVEEIGSDGSFDSVQGYAKKLANAKKNAMKKLEAALEEAEKRESDSEKGKSSKPAHQPKPVEVEK